MKKITKILVMGVALIMCLGIFALSGCTQSYTEAEHIQRITERVQSRFMGSDSEYAELYTDFSVELLYNAKDEPAYFMVEFNPDGFLYGVIDRGNYYFDSGRTVTSFAGTIEWRGGTFYGGSRLGEAGQGWRTPEYFSPNYEWFSSLSMNCLSVNQEGWYFRSHFDFSNITNEKKYMNFSFNIKDNRIEVIFCLVKRNDAYICVVSGQEYESAWFEQVSKKGLTRKQRNKLTQI